MHSRGVLIYYSQQWAAGLVQRVSAAVGGGRLDAHMGGRKQRSHLLSRGWGRSQEASGGIKIRRKRKEKELEDEMCGDHVHMASERPG